MQDRLGRAAWSQPATLAHRKSIRCEVFRGVGRALIHRPHSERYALHVAAAVREEQSLKELEAACIAYKRAPPSEVGTL